MNAWFPLLKARTVILFSAVLVLAGSVPVLYFVALFVWQIGMLFQVGKWAPLPATLPFTDHPLVFVPEFPWTAPKAVGWLLDNLHVGLVPAVVGCAMVALGALGVLRQKAVIRLQKQRKEDRLRRMRDYRREDSQADALEGRREPFIGSA